MPDISRRYVLSGVAAAGGMVAAAMASDANADGQPPFGPTPPVLAGAQLPSFRFPLGAKERQDLGRRLGEAGDRRGVSGVGEARRRPDGAGAGRPARAALARQRGRVGLHDQGPVPGHDHRPDGPFRDRRFRPGRRLVLPARPRPLDPEHRARGLPVRARLRQRLFLRVRHLQHHATGSGTPRPRCCRRNSACRPRPSPTSRRARSTSPRDRCRRRCRPTPRRARSTAAC